MIGIDALFWSIVFFIPCSRLVEVFFYLFHDSVDGSLKSKVLLFAQLEMFFFGFSCLLCFQNMFAY